MKYWGKVSKNTLNTANRSKSIELSDWFVILYPNISRTFVSVAVF